MTFQVQFLGNESEDKDGFSTVKADTEKEAEEKFITENPDKFLIDISPL